MLGRESELTVIDGLFTSARTSKGTVLCLEGEAGIGKTALCDQAVDRAMDMTVLRIIGSEWESHFPLEALSELLRPLRDRGELLMPAQREAVQALFGARGRPGLDPYALAGAALSLITFEALDHPVLVVVDDAHWLDDESSTALSFAFKRLGADRVAVLLALRTGQRTVLRGPWPVHRVEGLRPDDALRLLAERSRREVSPAVASDLIGMVDGNPLALIELADALTPRQLVGAEQLPDPLPVGARGVVSFGHKLAGLPAASRDALVVLAAAGSAPAATVGAALDRAGHSFADLEPAEDVGVVRLRDGSFRFTHPLIRAAAYSAATQEARRRAHRVMAEAVHHDIERRAWHVAAATIGPVEEVAETLDRAAEAAARRGGAPAAAPALVRAAELTPHGPARWRRQVRAAEALYLAGRWDDSVALLDVALSAPLDPAQRSDALVLQAKQATWSPRLAREATTLRTSFEELIARDDPNAVLVGLQLANVLTSTGRIPQVLEVTTRLTDLVTPTSPLADAVTLFHALARLMTGTAPCPPDLGVERFVALSQRVRPADLAFWAPTITLLWNWTDRTAEAAVLAERQLETVRALSAASLLPFPLLLLSNIRLKQGELAWARAHLDEAISISIETRLDGIVGLLRAARATVAAVEGDLGECSVQVAAALEAGRRGGLRNVEMLVNNARGLLALVTGQPETAVRHLQPNVELARASGLVLPGVIGWHGDYIQALVATGCMDEARATLEELEHDSARTESRWGRGVALRSRALLEPARAAQAVGDAIELQADFPYEQARSHLVLGDHLRRQGKTQQARVHLARAAHLFERCGARPWEDWANTSLQETGLHRARRAIRHERLTEQELRVSLAVADGATNKEAAAGLFLSEKTVEYHLAKAFRKLGVNNRTQLARALLRESPAASASPAAG